MSSSEPAIVVRNVTKKFKVYTEKNSTLKDRIVYFGRTRHKEFTALDSVSVDVPRGATVGLIGANGSGKSTLLKLMSRIMYPDSGSVEVNGRVSSLLELGAGFHPDFTGRENIFMNGAIFGLSKREIREKLDEIIDFSELHEFMDQPVRSYSSGMYMRLAFSVAVAVNPEILLVDEILAVGDAPFQAKCMGRIRKLKAANKTIVMVTHDMGAVTQFCDHAVWLHHGHVQMEGSATTCIQSYLERAYQESGNNVALDEPVALKSGNGTSRWGNGPAKISRISANSALGDGIVACGQTLDLSMEVQVDGGMNDVVLGFSIFDEAGRLCYESNTIGQQLDTISLRPGLSEITLHIPDFTLLTGSYAFDISIQTVDGKPSDYWKGCCNIRVLSELQDKGQCRIKHEWRIDG